MVNIEQKIHRAWHTVVGNMTAKEVAAMLTDYFIDPRYYMVAVPRERLSGKRRKRMYCSTCNCEVLKHLPETEARE